MRPGIEERDTRSWQLVPFRQKRETRVNSASWLVLASSYIHPTKDKERDNQLRLADTELDSDGDNQQKVNPLLVWPRGQAAGFQDWRKAQDGKVSEGSIHST